MLRMRRFDEQLAEVFYAGQVPGHVHLYIGQEATGTGVIARLRREDKIASHHRAHGHALAKGSDARRVMAEVFGRSTGYNRGKGGSMHFADLSVGFLGACGIVGGGVPAATGAALAFQLRHEDNVVVSFVGDGAMNEGHVNDALNLAGLWKLPIVYVCENNGYATTTTVAESTAAATYADRGHGFGIPGVVVDGMDVLAVYDAAGDAIARARRGEGPTLLEAKTYRFRGHFEGETEILGNRIYRSAEEIQEWKQRDPILVFGQSLRERGILTEDREQEIASEVASEIADAVAFARESPFPDPAEALEGVFV